MAGALKQAKRGELSQLAAKTFESLGLRQSIVDANESPKITGKQPRKPGRSRHARPGALRRATPRSNGPLLVEFLRVSALTRGDTEGDDEDEKKGKVTLMTLHSAKGLEFPYVFLVGMEEELLPHKRTIELGLDFGEERRLCYVGMTRARQRLWLSYCKNRMKYGRAEPRNPSRFLDEMPGEPHVLKRERHVEPKSEEEADAEANDFFAKMKAQLGIDG